MKSLLEYVKEHAMISKDKANYREATEHNKMCGLCDMYRHGKCTLVKGVIEVHHVCDYFESKE